MIDIAISPCPNDTFLFDAWINGKIDSPLTPQVTFADIQELNLMAQNGTKSVIKMSCFCFGQVTDRYKMLPIGAAIGQFGPKLIAKKPFALDELPNKTVCIPGKDTTAYLLFKTLCPTPKAIVECSFEKITSLINEGKADAGLIIHETRFTFQNLGFIEICDLGELFYQKFDLPVPLGVVCIRKDLQMDEVVNALQQSLDHAKRLPDLAFVMQTAQEKSVDVIKQHIATYVNAETACVSATGLQSIKTLFRLACDKNLLPKRCLDGM